MVSFDETPIANFKNLKLEDYRVYLRVLGFHAMQTGKGQASNWMGFLAIFLIFTLLVLYLFYSDKPSLMTPVFFLVALVVFFFVFRQFQLRKTVSLSRGPIQVSLEDKGIRWNDALCDSVMRWTAVQGFYEREKLIIGVVDAMRCLIIPSRGFANEEEYEQFKQAIITKILLIP